MISTEQTYDVVVGDIASLDKRIGAVATRYGELPDRAFSQSHFGRSKQEAVGHVRDLVADGNILKHDHLVKATPYYHIDADYEGRTTGQLAYAKRLDGLVEADVARAGLRADEAGKPGKALTLLERLVPGHTEDVLRREIQEASRQREVALNLGRLLKVATAPEAALYGFNGVPAARIDRIAADADTVKKKDWVTISEVTLKALSPVPLDEHVVDHTGPVPYSVGHARIVFGNNKYGQSDHPVEGTVERHAYSTRLTLHATPNEAEKVYRQATEQREGVTVRHTPMGNFIGGTMTDPAIHPMIGSPEKADARSEPWLRETGASLRKAAVSVFSS